MEKRIVRVGSRESALAVAQTWLVLNGIREKYPEIEFELVAMKTTGDKILDRTLDKVGGKGLFVKELDRALQDGAVELTIHSLKDVPLEPPDDLPLLAYFKRGDPRDALVLRNGDKNLQDGGIIGCSSARRTLQLKTLYPQCVVKPVRGNILTRLAKLDAGEYDALVLAAAGLERMGLSHRVSRYFETWEMVPAAGQGVLAVQGRKGDAYPFLQAADDPGTRSCALAERAFVRELNGGCSSPVAAYAEISGERLHLTGLYPHPVTGAAVIKHIWGAPSDPERLGIQLARDWAKIKTVGKVWLVGAGPGDPGLLTVKGQNVLDKAEVVIYDRLIGPGILARIPKTAEAIDVGKRSGDHPVPQWRINELLLEKSMEGKRVVRLKGGDPFVFGRGGEELELLAGNQVPFEVVPGITSAVAVPAYSGIPVTHRDCCSSFHVITGHTREGESLSINFSALAALKGTLVFLMGLSSLSAIAEGLLSAGMAAGTPAAVLEKGTTAHQRRVVSTLGKITQDVIKAGMESPAIIVVGEVCALAGRLAWAEKRPLGGVRVLVTRPQENSSVLSGKLAELGAEVVEIPGIETVSLEDSEPLRKVLRRLGEFGWLAFSSPSGVRFFFEELFAAGMDGRDLAGRKIAAVGAATAAALSARGIRADLIPETYDGLHLGEALSAEAGKILLLRPDCGSSCLPDVLRAAGKEFEEAVLYRTAVSKGTTFSLENLLAGKQDYALFTSGSAVRGFLRYAGNVGISQIRALCIGDRTAAAARAAGMQVFVSDSAAIDAMIDKLLQLVRETADSL